MQQVAKQKKLKPFLNACAIILSEYTRLLNQTCFDDRNTNFFPKNMDFLSASGANRLSRPLSDSSDISGRYLEQKIMKTIELLSCYTIKQFMISSLT